MATEPVPSDYELRPVRLGSTGSGRPSGLLAGIVALAVLIAIAKPWAVGGSGSAAQPGESGAAVSPLASPSQDPEFVADPAAGFSSRAYDPKIFGFREPAAAWGIWPAGFLVTFGFVIQVPDGPAAGTLPPSFDPGPRPSEPVPSATEPGGEPAIAWPAGFEVPEGNHLLLIGINMPPGHTVTDAVLSRLDAGGAEVPVPIERLKSPWPSHFVVVAMAGGTGGLLDVWPPGHYRLDATFGPEGIARSVEIIVAPAR